MSGMTGFKSTATIFQAIAIAILAIMLGDIFKGVGFQLFWIYQRSIDYIDFCFRVLQHWVSMLGG